MKCRTDARTFSPPFNEFHPFSLPPFLSLQGSMEDVWKHERRDGHEDVRGGVAAGGVGGGYLAEGVVERVCLW